MQQDIRTIKQTSCVGMIVLCLRQVWWSWVHAPLRTVCQFCPTPKIALRKSAKWAVDYSISLNFCTVFKRMTPKVLQKFKVKRSKAKVTAWHNVCKKIAKLSIIQLGISRFRSNSVQNWITWRLIYHELSRSTGQRSRSQRDITYQHKNAITQARISCRRSNLVKIIPEPSATRNTILKLIWSNTEITITSPGIARLRSNLIQSFIMSEAIRCKCSRSKVKGQWSSSQHKVMYQKRKRYSTAIWIGSATSN